jgi:outer membrane protein assembly factor BamA
MLIEAPFWPVKRFVIFSERVDLINRINDFFYNEEGTAGWVPTFSYKGSLGTGGGFTVFHSNLFKRRYGANASVLYSNQKNFSLRSSLSTPFYGNFPWKNRLIFNVLYRKDSDEPFYVRETPERVYLGHETNPEDEKSYELDTLEPNLSWNFAFTPHLFARLKALSLFTETEPGSGKAPIPASLPGAQAHSSFFGGGTTLTWDDRDNTHRPVNGTFIHLYGSALKGMQSDSAGRNLGWTHWEAEVQKLFPLFWGPHRTFLLRGFVESSQPLAGREVPFYVLPRLDQNHALRGFDRNRFQDRAAFVMNLEYRYPIWETWDAVLFVDHGSVFPDLASFHWAALQRSFGGAINFLSENGFLFLLQYGISGDQSELLLSLQQAF